MEVHLLEKTELFIKNIQLDHVNLNKVAEVTAAVLGLNHRNVAVIDTCPGIITVDILRETMNFEQIIGKERALLEALGAISGVTVTDQTSMHSEGVLGLINLNEGRAAKLPAKVQKLNRQISNAVHFRAIIFPTGEEIIEGTIEDTNTPFLAYLLTSLGYRVTRKGPLKDSLDQMIVALRDAADMGYGLVITTGGVGAEDKDHSVEAILALDAGAATPYVVHYSPGQGRHKKDGVRIAVGSLDWTTFIALPGPHDEIQLVAPTLAQGLCEQWDKSEFAEKLVKPLRDKLIKLKTAVISQ